MIPFGIGRESERDAGSKAHIYRVECFGRILSLADWELRIPKSPEQKAEEEHTVNGYEQEEREREQSCDCVIASN